MKEIPVSKILVLDRSSAHARRLKKFCDDHQLVPLKVRNGAVMSVLRKNIDLGGILLAEDYGQSQDETARIALEIHTARPELPIIIRRETQATLDDLPPSLQRTVCGAYIASDMRALERVIGEYIFCTMYPNALLRGIGEITAEVLGAQFGKFAVSVDTPYIVRDRILFGELFSLIPLESSWCRGYMTLQCEESLLLAALGDLDRSQRTPDFRRVNDRLSEITNLIWGSFKNRYIGDTQRTSSSQVQIPLIVNHKHRYMSFGTDNPQLCFRFTLTDPTSGRAEILYTRFIFNLSWSPEEFKEFTMDPVTLVDSGELELF